MARQKFYVVWRGITPGIYTQWADAEKQVKGVAGARYKSFPSRAEAEAALQAGPGRTGDPENRARGDQQPASSDRTAAGAVAWHEVDIYCDGACDPNPGPSGSGLAVYSKRQLDALWYGLYNPAGTNNTAELQALYHALKLARGTIESGLETAIHCDSRYAIDCVTKWAFAWKSRNWTRRSRTHHES